MVSHAGVTDHIGSGVQIEEVEVNSPGPGEVLVRIVTCGICRTDVAFARGELGHSVYPVVLGHEIAGIVDGLGLGVNGFRSGDRVIFLLDAHCGYCSECVSGHPALCTTTTGLAEAAGFRRDSGEMVFRHRGGFSQRSLFPAESLVRLPDAVPFEVGSLVACCVSTGYGAVVRLAGAAPEDRVLVIGTGGVGLSAIMTAKLRGVRQIHAFDHDRGRLIEAQRFGSTAASDSEVDVPRRGFDVVLDCVGKALTFKLGMAALATGGRLIVVGVPPDGELFELDAHQLLVHQQKVIGCMMGDIRPGLDTTAIFDAYESGALPIDSLVTKRLALADLPSEIGANEPRPGLRTIVEIDPALSATDGHRRNLKQGRALGRHQSGA